MFVRDQASCDKHLVDYNGRHGSLKSAAPTGILRGGVDPPGDVYRRLPAVGAETEVEPGPVDIPVELIVVVVVAIVIAGPIGNIPTPVEAAIVGVPVDRSPKIATVHGAKAGTIETAPVASAIRPSRLHIPGQHQATRHQRDHQ